MASKQEYCKNGHSMDEYRRIHPNGDSYCSACKVERTKKSRKAHPEKHSEYGWRSRIKGTYGITEEDYSQMFIEQQGQCGICFSSLIYRDKATHIDHDHDTGEVRGLLCHGCNTAIGLLKEDIDVLASAINYLSETKKKPKKK